MKRSRFLTLVPYSLLFVLLFGLTAWKSIGDQPNFELIESNPYGTEVETPDILETVNHVTAVTEKVLFKESIENFSKDISIPVGVEIYHSPLSSSSVFLLEFNELSPTVLGLSSTETVEMNRSDHSKNSGLDLSALAIEDPSSSLWPLEIASAGDQLNIPIEEHKYFLWDQIKDFAYQQKSLLDSLGRYTAGLRYNSRLSVSRIKYVKQSRSILTTDAKYKFVSFPDRNGWIRDSVFIMVPSGYKSKTLDRRTLSRSFSGRDCTIYTCASRRGYKKPNLSKGNRRLGCPSGTSLRKLSTKEPLNSGKKKAIIIIPRYK